MEFCANRSSLIYLLFFFFFPEGVDKASYWNIDLDLFFYKINGSSKTICH